LAEQKRCRPWIVASSFSPQARPASPWPCPARRRPGHAAAPARRRFFYVDAQGGIDGFDTPEGGRPVPSERLIEAIRERRIDLVSATIGPVGNGPDRYRDSVEGVAYWDRLIAEHSALLAKVESAADIRAARAAGKVGSSTISRTPPRSRRTQTGSTLSHARASRSSSSPTTSAVSPATAASKAPMPASPTSAER
jgi:hypothetical protein